MNKNKNNVIDNRRRSILKTFATSGISKTLINSSPLVAGMLFARHADAQLNGTPNKSLILYVPGGAIKNQWDPTGSGSSMSMRNMSQGYDGVKTDCNFLIGGDIDTTAQAGGHTSNMTQLLVNNWNGDTYDVHMGKTLGPDMPFSFINLGVHSNGQGYLTREGNKKVAFEDNPFTAFRLYLGDNSNTGNAKTNIMDAHAAAANAIRSKLAGYEVDRLDSHLQAISDTRRRLEELSGGTGSCSASPNATEFPVEMSTFSQQARLQADIAVAALKCGVTSSVSLGFGNHQGQFSFRELNYNGNYHQSAHDGSNGQSGYPNYAELRAHLGSLSAYAIRRLREEGILDETVVVEFTEMGHQDLHSSDNIPFIIAGGGSAIQRGKTTSASGFSQYDVFHTAAKACGVTLNYGREIPGVLTAPV